MTIVLDITSFWLGFGAGAVALIVAVAIYAIMNS